MKVKLLRELLVGPADAMAMRAGTEHEMDDARARELVNLGLVEEVGGEKAAPAHQNKMSPEPDNKSATPIGGTAAPAKPPKAAR